MWDLAGEEREGEGSIYPGNYKKKTSDLPPTPDKFYSVMSTLEKEL